jgi:hypothetical protein
MRLYTRFKLWLWDRENADVLALAERRLTVCLGQGYKSHNLERVISKLIRDRNLIEFGVTADVNCNKGEET